jgi:hypothetical protein
MTHMILATSASPGPLGDWRPLLAMLAGFFAVVAALAVLGGRREGETFSSTLLLPRVSRGLERVTKIPGWAAAAVGQGSFGLLIAGMGFYNDVAWHVRLGRDKNLFTAPHTAIVVGLFMIFTSAIVGTLIANADGVDVGFKIRNWRIPYSMLALGLLGGSALSGFPLDDLWHRFYGIDVTMWSPTHLLMIVGASLSPIATWLALAEAKVSPRDGAWARGLHVTVAMCALLGLASTQGEFEFGVPQFQQLYHPILIALAAGLALTAARLVLGRFWPFLIGAMAAFFGTGGGSLFAQSDSFARSSALFIFSAAAVELAALLVGTKHRIRYAIVCGIGVGTLGLAGEWWWNRHAFQPWTTNLLPDAAILGLVTAIGAAVLGTAFATAILRERGVMRPAVIAVAFAMVLFSLAWALPRKGSDVTAQVSLRHVGSSKVIVTAHLEPANAADHARWFQTMSWQGGGFEVANMKQTQPGVWVSSKAMPVGGPWKTMLRLHRGAEMSAIPIWMPGDLAIGAPEIPAVDKTAQFKLETQYLLREQHGGPGWFSMAVLALLALIAVLWIGSFVLAASKVGAASSPDVLVGAAA